MTNIEKIVADYETCRKAYSMGLRACFSGEQK